MRTVRGVVAVVGAVALLAGLCWAVPAGAGAITIKYSDSDPPGGVRTNFVKNFWIPEISNRPAARSRSRITGVGPW